MKKTNNTSLIPSAETEISIQVKRPETQISITITFHFRQDYSKSHKNFTHFILSITREICNAEQPDG